MERILKDYEPKKVFRFFEEISDIPRASGKEEKAAKYLVDFARKRELDCECDEHLNVIIRKPATRGYENAPRVIIQGHSDMVCEKNASTLHDFDNDPLKLIIDGDKIYANGTTLGADDGIGVAYALALLDSEDIPHPPLTVIITACEEVGLLGANTISPKYLDGDYLINLDCNFEDIIVAGCAGGITFNIEAPITWTKPTNGTLAYHVGIRGLLGGHSGLDVNSGRGNSNKLIARVLNQIGKTVKFDIASIFGGMKSNAIPREADAVIMLNSSDAKIAAEIVMELEKIFKKELRFTDKGVTVVFEPCSNVVEAVFDFETQKKIMTFYMTIYNGVYTMSRELPGLVECSGGFTVVETGNEVVKIVYSIRSNCQSIKEATADSVHALIDALGLKATVGGEYPSWEYKADSKLIKLVARMHEKQFGKNADIIASHGGNECAIFLSKKPGLEVVCFGPDGDGLHTPDEYLSISSVGRVWGLIIDTLKEIKNI